MTATCHMTLCVLGAQTPTSPKCQLTVGCSAHHPGRPHRDFLVHQQYWDLYPAGAAPLFPPASRLCVQSAIELSPVRALRGCACVRAAEEIETAKHPTRSASQPLIAFHAAGFTLPNGSNYPGTPVRLPSAQRTCTSPCVFLCCVYSV